MLSATLPQIDTNQLFRRLARLRRRLRLVTLLRGIFTLFAVLVGGAAIEGLIDWRFQLPALVRAMSLCGIVAGAGYVVMRRLLVPLGQPTDNLHLALKLEERYPELNDVLASALQFLDQPTDDESSSPLLRRLAIRRAVRMSEDCRFNELISLGGLFWSFVLAMLTITIALPFALAAPTAAKTAMNRLLAPFGTGEWPAQTALRIVSPDRWPYRHALGEPLEIRAEISGVVPERATFTIWFDGTPPVDSTWMIERNTDDETGELIVRMEASKVQRGFRFRLKANDGATPWLEVQVLPPAELAPLDGRPSPQLLLEYPAYTDLPVKHLPDGGSSFEAVAGTTVHLRAGVNRPVARAWIVYRPERPILNTGSALLALASDSPLNAATATAVGMSVWDRIPVTLDRNGTLLEATFTPRVAGVYALRFEDETGFGATRLIDARVFADPAPTVTLDRPSPSLDSLNVTPDAVLPLKSLVTDTIFAVRSSWLEYRTAKAGPVTECPLYDHRAMGWALQLTGEKPVRVRKQEIRIDDQLRLASLHHPDGSKLKEGDTVIVQMAADDFDDVTGNKEPGRSHEIELHIVSAATLEALLQRDQTNVRQSLLQMQQWQKEAREKVADAKVQLEKTGKLRPEDLEKLAQAEQLQQQIRARVGNEKDGLRAEVNRIRQAQQDNHLPPSATKDRMDSVANELERLAQEDLEAVEPLLNSARENREPSNPPKTEPAKSTPKPEVPQKENQKEPLKEALKHQTEIEKTLDKMLQRLEPWSSANEVHAEARSMLDEQEKLNQETHKLDSQIPPNERPDRLDPQQQADLDKAATRQESLDNQLNQLTKKMEKLASDKEAELKKRQEHADQLEAEAQKHEKAAEQAKGADRGKAEKAEAQKLREQASDERATAQAIQKEIDALKESSKIANDELKQESGGASAPSKLRDAAQDMRQNKLGSAKERQKESTKAMQKMLDRLEEKRSDDLDRLAKKMRELEQRIDDLTEQQDHLQKKVKEAQQIPDPQQRQQELDKLAQEQQQLRDEAKDLVEELSRAKADAAARSLSRAERAMDDAQQRLQRGERADESQEDAADKLDRAQDELQKDREHVDDELMREKSEKAMARIKALRDRQESSNKETKRVHETALKAKKWEDAVLKSLVAQRDVEEGLAKELARLRDDRFKPVRIMEKLLEQSADAMTLAADRIEVRRKDVVGRPPDEPFDPVLEAKLQGDIAKWQETALRRLDQFLDAMKPEEEAKKLQSGNESETKTGGGSPMNGRPPAGESVPLLAQLKALRSLQAEINERTAQFAKDHPDLSKLSDSEQEELTAIRKMQHDIADLVREYGISDEPAPGERP